MKRTLLSASIALIGSISLPGQALAADSAASPTDTAALDKIVVTAQRREESAQDVGVAISVISGEELAERGVTKINQLKNLTPSLEIEPAFGGGQPQFRLRGIGFQDYATNNSSPVGVYLGDVALPLPVQTQGQLFDLERVEVLRGPQGTLYGRNTTGGAINFIPAKPTRETSYGVTASYGSFGELIAEAYASGSLSSSTRARLSFATDQGGGWQHNRVTDEKLGDKNLNALRAQIEVDASERLKFALSAHYDEDKSENQGLYLFNSFATKGGTGITIPADTDTRKTGWGLRPAFAQEIGVAADAKPSKDNVGSGLALNATLALDSFKLTSITSFEYLNRHELADWDASTSNESDEYFKTRANVFSEEIRVASNKGQNFNWVAGAYLAHEKLNEKFYSDFQDVWGAAARTTYSQQADTYAIFGQSDTRLARPLKLVTGLRYEREERKLEDFSTSWVGAASPLTGPASRSQSSNALTGKLGLEYELAKNALLYASISRGVKSGGFTAYNAPVIDQIAPVKPEVLWAYELGFKSDLSRSVRLNGAAYYYDYTNQQVQSAIFDSVYGPVGKIVNAPKSSIKGAELELEWVPISGLKIGQAIGYKTGKYKEFTALDVQASLAAWSSQYRNLEGSSLNFPKLSYGGSLSYSWETSGYHVRAETDYSYHDKYNSWLGSAYDIDSYWLANARVIVSPVGSRWSVALWGKNIFNQKYDQTRNFFVNAQVASAGEPATVGLQLNVTY
jgi:outer membrane receptor protein involved in Fe transport